ncbi:MAG: hypothetical protein KGD66_02510 [Candidatus Lokiarchaeota archaeon]|nr:hypothetical protein [Candidatus Lokiarchaeota archaeon]
MNNDGELIDIYKLDFNDNETYVVDDIIKNVIYIWVGLNVSDKQKKFAAEFARQIERVEDVSTHILIMKQKREFGSFLAMMNDFRKGLIPGKTAERRPELKLEHPIQSPKQETQKVLEVMQKDETETPIIRWLEQIKAHREIEGESESPYILEQAEMDIDESLDSEEEFDFEYQTREGAYFFSIKNFTYDELCWFLAEKIQKINYGMPSLLDIKKKAEEIYNSSITYDELCWLNSEIDLLLNKNFLQQETVKFK